VKKGIFFQIIIIFLILLAWNLFHLGYEFQKDTYERNISSSQMVVLSMQGNTLKILSSKIQEFDYINEISIIQDSVISQTLIKSYELKESNDILRSYILPTAMQISFEGDKFKIEQKIELERTLLEYTPVVIYYFDDAYWQINQNKIIILTKGYYAGFGLFIIFMLFITIFLRIHFETKSNHFWKVYYSSGGHFGKRRKQFFINSLYLCFIPFILNAAIYFALFSLQFLPVEIDYRFFGIELATLILSALFSGLFLGKELK